MKTFILEYTVKSTKGVVIKHGKMRAKNKFNSFDAKVKLEEFLQKKYTDFGQLIVHSCEEETLLHEIFKGDTPFHEMMKNYIRNSN